MKRFALYLGLATAMMASCSILEEDFKTPQQDDVVFYASFEQPADEGTRVYANEDLLLRWTADDRVSIFNKVTYNQEYRFTGETGDNAGGFDKVAGSEFTTGNAISHIVSVYPYQKSTKISENENLTIELPAEQLYADNTFGLGANTMVSVTSDNLLQYKNVGGYLVLKLYGEGVSVSSITLKGNNGEKLAGKANVSMPVNGVPTMTMANDATSEIILTCATPVQLGTDADNSTQFWFVVPPVTFSNGFTVQVKGASGGIFEKSTAKSITIERNKVSKMSQMEVELSGQPNNEIWYTTSDGTPVQLYSYSSDIVSNEYKDGKGVITFKDDVTRIDDYTFGWSWNLTTVSLPDSIVSIGDYAFSGSWQLTSISFPKSLTSIGAQAFSQCIILNEVTIPESVTSIGEGAFGGCYSLTSFSGKYASKDGLYLLDGGTLLAAATGSMVGDITLPEGITAIQGYTFYCSMMTSIDIPANLTSIGRHAFDQCRNLTSVTIPESVTSIGEGAFADCSSLTSFSGKYASKDGLYLLDGGTLLAAAVGSMVGDITLPDGITAIQGFTFYNCSKMTSLDLQDGVIYIGPQSFLSCTGFTEFAIPSSVISIGIQAFARCTNLQSITIPEGVTSIGDLAFEECKSLTSITLKPETPPTTGFHVLFNANDCPIYVPSGSIEAYRSAPNWSDYADRIQAIPVPEAIDLGLPSGLKWASFNLGASKPEEYGDYYAWGETEPYYNCQDPLTWKKDKTAGYNWASYKWCMGSNNTITKYCSISSYGFDGFTDTKTVLDLEDDAAHVNLGGNWRMPTDAEWTELRENCSWTRTTHNGVEGILFTASNGNSIFLPAAGFRSDTNIYNVGSYGYYWLSFLITDSPYYALILGFDSDYAFMSPFNRNLGCSVRPVFVE